MLKTNANNTCIICPYSWARRPCKSLAGDRQIIAYIDIWAFLTTQQHPRHKCLSQIITQQKENDVHLFESPLTTAQGA